MQAIQYWKSVPRYLAAKFLGPRLPWIYTSGWACLRFGQVGEPALPGPRWVRVRPRLSGICGSDLAALTAKGSTYFSPFTSCPFVFGHEVVGEVVEVGPQVRVLRPGARVVLEPPLHCEIRGIQELCAECRRGRRSHCRRVTEGILAPGIQTGFCRDTGGGWSESLVAHELQLHLVREGLEAEQAVLIEPLGCCLNAVHQARPRDEETVLVIGCGSIGVLTIWALRLLGVGCRVIAVAKYQEQGKWARRLGADEVVFLGPHFYGEMAERLSAKIFQPELGPPVFIGGADRCFDCIGSSRSIDDALRLTRSMGSVVLVGMPGIPKGVDWTSIWYKELQVSASYTCERPVFEEAVRMVEERGETLKGFVGAKFSLRQYREAIHCALNSGGRGVLKTAFTIP